MFTEQPKDGSKPKSQGQAQSADPVANVYMIEDPEETKHNQQ